MTIVDIQGHIMKTVTEWFIVSEFTGI